MPVNCVGDKGARLWRMARRCHGRRWLAALLLMSLTYSVGLLPVHRDVSHVTVATSTDVQIPRSEPDGDLDPSPSGRSLTEAAALVAATELPPPPALQRTAWFEKDWEAVYRVALLVDPDEAAGLAPSFYSRRRLNLVANVTVACASASSSTDTSATQAPGSDGLGEWPEIGVRIYASSSASDLAWFWGPCIRFDSRAITGNVAPMPVQDFKFSPGWLVVQASGSGAPPLPDSCTERRQELAVHVPLQGHLETLVPAAQLQPNHQCEPHTAPSDRAPDASVVILVLRHPKHRASILHAVADWFSVLDALEIISRETQSGMRASDGGWRRLMPGGVQVVFLDDGAAEPHLAATWTTLFGKKPMQLSAAVAQDLRMQHALLVSPSLWSPIVSSSWGGDLGHVRSPSLARFGEFLLLRHALSTSKPMDTFHVAAGVLDTEDKETVIQRARMSVRAFAPSGWLVLVFNDLGGAGADSAAAVAEMKHALIKRWPEALSVLQVHAVHLKQATVREQLAVFRSSDVIVCPHSDLLAWTVVARFGTLVVELKPPPPAADERPHNYAALVEASGAVYAKVDVPVLPAANSSSTAVFDGMYSTIVFEAVASIIAQHHVSGIATLHEAYL